MIKDRPHHYCIMTVNPGESEKNEIVEIQGLTWFETEDLAWQYFGFMNDSFRNLLGPVACISEENLPYHFDCNSEYIKAKLTGTRLLKSNEPVGVKVTNDQEVIKNY